LVLVKSVIGPCHPVLNEKRPKIEVVFFEISQEIRLGTATKLSGPYLFAEIHTEIIWKGPESLEALQVSLQTAEW